MRSHLLDFSFTFVNCLYVILILLIDSSGFEIDPLPLCVVSMSMVRPDSSLNHYRLLTISLALLAVLLIAVDIGLGVYCKSLLTHKAYSHLHYYCKHIVVLDSYEVASYSQLQLRFKRLKVDFLQLTRVFKVYVTNVIVWLCSSPPPFGAFQLCFSFTDVTFLFWLAFTALISCFQWVKLW